LSLLAGTSTAVGDLLVWEEFDHPDGSLTGQTPNVGGVWTSHSGTAGQMQVVSGQAKVNHALSEDTHTDFDGGAIGAGDVIYSGFDLTVPTQSVNPNNVYFAHFKDAGNFFGSRVWITAPAVSGNGYRLGITGDSSLEVATDLFPLDLAFDTTYRVVTKYDFDTGESRLWVDPVNELSPSALSDDSFAGDEFESYALRESSANSMQLIDCLQVATTFDEAAICIPEPGTMLLMVVAGLAAIGFGRRAAR
jgi:hypothetical protein